MKAGRRVCESVHMAALGLWLGALVLTAAAAAMLFPTMKMLQPALPGYALYTGEHWLIAGGHVVQRMFLALDVAQFAAALVAGATFGAAVMWFGLSMKRVSTFVRVFLLLALIALLAYRMGFLEPEMADNLRRYWAAAAAGDNATALRYKELFDASHPLQSRLLGLTAVLVLALMVGGVWSFAKDDGRGEGVGAAREGGLQEPLLVKGRR
jgi:hypothetical protein